MKYVVRDEDGEIMRIVGRREEARQLTLSRPGWTFTGIRTPKVQLDLSQFEEALL